MPRSWWWAPFASSVMGAALLLTGLPTAVEATFAPPSCANDLGPWPVASMAPSSVPCVGYVAPGWAYLMGSSILLALAAYGAIGAYAWRAGHPGGNVWTQGVTAALGALGMLGLLLGTISFYNAFVHAIENGKWFAQELRLTLMILLVAAPLVANAWRLGMTPPSSG